MRSFRLLSTRSLLPLALLAGVSTLFVTASAPAGVLASEASTEAVEYAVDGVHSSVMFHVTHMGVAPFYGRFNKLSGDIVIDTDPKKSSVKVTIDTGSVDSNSEGRDKHLRSPDFLDAVQFPEATFESTSVELKDKKGGVYAITGKLNLHGVEKEVVLEMTMAGPRETGRGTKAGFGGTLVINRRDFEMTAMGDDMISNEIKLFFGIEADEVARIVRPTRASVARFAGS